jgi:Ca2+-binding RTX toxin-like protein
MSEPVLPPAYWANIDNVIYGTKKDDFLQGEDSKNDLVSGGKGNDTIAGGLTI